MSSVASQYFHLLSRQKEFQIGFETPLTDAEAMTLALRRAIEGSTTVSPNPPVGCVILSSEGRVLAVGHHLRAGQAHAEIEALKALADIDELERSADGWNFEQLKVDELRGAKVFVTLEPCSHEGRTPSCAKTLAKLPISELVYGVEDPNPLVQGRGAEILRQAGIRVRNWQKEDQSGLAQGLRDLIEIFSVNVQEKRPFVSLKMASSLDGQMALKNGSSQWITSEAARNFGMYLRGLHDAVLVGVDTILADDPQLNLRLPLQQGKASHLVILDPHGKLFLKPQLKIFKAHAPHQISIFTEPQWLGAGVPFNHFGLNLTEGRFELSAVLENLYEKGLRSIYVEGGAFTISEFIRQKLADRLWLFQAPAILGAGRSWTQSVDLQLMEETIAPTQGNFLDLSPDWLMSFRLSH